MYSLNAKKGSRLHNYVHKLPMLLRFHSKKLDLIVVFRHSKKVWHNYDQQKTS